jgi:aminopeptidase-like protein
MMQLGQFADPRVAAEVAAEALALMRELYPICRSITGNGVRRSLDLLERWIPLERTEVPTGTTVFDWEVPREWNIRDAWVADATGRRVIDFRQHNLHVVNYSVPVRQSMMLDELQPHLHSLPDRPDWIPYRTSYYREDWGFCLKHSERERLRPGRYEVVVDADLAPGSLTLGECTIPGQGDGEAIIYTHTCHPSLANDNLSGIAVAAALARALRETRPRLTWRFIFGPGTIGSLAWLARNESRLSDIRAGLVLGLLGDSGPLTYKRSRQGDGSTDRVAEFVLGTSAPGARVADFEPYGYDERQFCSPGFNLPVGRLTRSPNGTYAEYHSSADDLSLVSAEKMAQSLLVLSQLLAVLDLNRFPVSLCPKGEPRLGKRGLYGHVGGAAPAEFERALLWIMNQADGQHDLVSIARKSALPFDLVERATAALEEAGLVAHSKSGYGITQGKTR